MRKQVQCELLVLSPFHSTYLALLSQKRNRRSLRNIQFMNVTWMYHSSMTIRFILLGSPISSHYSLWSLPKVVSHVLRNKLARVFPCFLLFLGPHHCLYCQNSLRQANEVILPSCFKAHSTWGAHALLNFSQECGKCSSS